MNFFKSICALKELYIFLTSNKYRIKILRNEAKKIKSVRRSEATELFYLSVMEQNFRNLFAVLNFWFFSFKRKEHKNSFDGAASFGTFSCAPLAHYTKKITMECF